MSTTVAPLCLLFPEYSPCLNQKDSVRVYETIMQLEQSAELQRTQIPLMSLDMSRLREKPSNLLSGCVFITFCRRRLRDTLQSSKFSSDELVISVNHVEIFPCVT